TRGKHTLHTGFELNYVARGDESFGWSNGTFTFGTFWTQQLSDRNQNQFDGSGVATLLLGAPTSGAIDYNDTTYRTRPYYGVHVQDDWKVNRRLTLNLGLRYEVQVPWLERFNRETRGFDTTTKNPLSDQVLANWVKFKADYDKANPNAKYPYPAPPAVLTGGYLFMGVNGQPRRLYDTDWTNFAPRIGLAWRVRENTVLRAGGGVYYQSPTQTGVISGFNQQTPYTTSLDGFTPSAGLTGPYSLVNPFPNGIATAPHASLGLLTNIGNSLSFDPPRYKIPRTYQYSFGIQHQLPYGIVGEVSYSGNYQIYIESGFNLNNPSLEDNNHGLADAAYLNRSLPNPFFGILPITSSRGGSPTTTAFNLLRPDAIFGDITNNLVQAGHYRSDALQVKVERRMLGGRSAGGVMTWVLSYTYAKAYEQNHRLNNWNAQEPLIYELDNTDKPQNLAFSGVWDLPFGRDRRFFNSNPLVNAIAGDWRFDWIFTYLSGYPVGWPNLQNVCGEWHAKPQTPDHWFNNDKSCYRQFPSFTVRTIPDRFPDIRQPAVGPQLNAALEKTVHLSEQYRFQFRVESFNATNHPIRGNVDTGFTSPTFGQLPRNQNNFPRFFQIAGKFYF
ncbi:MAG TPA: TonB-dependent receptor, partial [Acidobacteriota bacterium]|nr:TonB-dependent receptor [Acidobacteriota bacterium]